MQFFFALPFSKQKCLFDEEILRKENVETQFVAWNKFMGSKTGVTGIWSFTNLFYLKSEESPVDPKLVKQPFISNFTIDQNATNEPYKFLKNLKVNMSIWNGPISYDKSD